MSTRVRLPDRDADRPRPAGLVAVALAALCAGVAVSHSLRSVQPDQAVNGKGAVARGNRPTPTPLDAGSAIGTSAIDVASARAGALDAGPSKAQPSSAREMLDAGQRGARPPLANIDHPPSDRPEPTDDRPKPTEPAHFQRGIVAYLRCDGVPQLPGRIPCPRDLVFEQQVWRALHELERCELTSLQRGQAEVRLVLGRGGYEATRVYAPSQDGLDPQTVTKCAGRALSSVRTTLQPEHMIVRFLFELR